VICAADRDENKAGAGDRRGERSARHLALFLAFEERSPVRTMIALPGKPGSNTDFLDLLRAEGREAVRVAILAAAPFQPTPEELEEFKNRGARKSEIEGIADRYPLPPLIGLRIKYRHTEDNRVWLHKYAGFDKETDEHLWDPVSSPFGALVLLETADRNRLMGCVFISAPRWAPPTPSISREAIFPCWGPAACAQR
jgi:hypothetical protein